MICLCPDAVCDHGIPKVVLAGSRCECGVDHDSFRCSAHVWTRLVYPFVVCPQCFRDCLAQVRMCNWCHATDCIRFNFESVPA